MIDAEKSDLYDVLAYIAFAMAPITREERVHTHKAQIYSHYDDKLQTFLDFVLGEYVQQGVGELDVAKLPDLLALRHREVNDAARQLGGLPEFARLSSGFKSIFMHAFELAFRVAGG